jgi:hypothetical protein
MAMLLEQRKLTAALQCQLEKLQHEGKAVQQSQENELVKVKAGIRKLDEDVEARLRTLREEIMELLYSGDATA